MAGAHHDCGGVTSLVEAQVAELRRLMPPIDAIGIGGSHGRGTADAVSDLDFFLVVPDALFWPHVMAFPSLIRHPAPVVSQGVGRFMSDYGYRLAFILEGGHKVEYFFNSPLTMTSLPLSARIQVVEDVSGFLTTCLAEARAEFDESVARHVAAGVHDCLVEIHDLRKHAARGDLLPMIWRLNTLRRPVLALHHMMAAGDVYAPSSAVSRLRGRAGTTLVRHVEASVPGLDPASIAVAYSHLRTVMLESFDHFSPCGIPTAAQRELEQVLSEETLASLAQLAGGRVT